MATGSDTAPGRAPRHARFTPPAGRALAGESRDFTVSTIHANIIAHFGDQPSWELGELAAKMEVAPALLKRKLTLWLNHGIIVRHGQGATLRYEVVTSLDDEPVAAVEVEELQDPAADAGGGGRDA